MKFLLEPPSNKGTGIRTDTSMGYMHMYLFIPAACDLDIYQVEVEWFGAINYKIIRLSKIIN